MGLIKSAEAPPSLSPFSMADIERQAKNMLLRAQQQAEQLLAAAQAEAEAIKQQAQADGLAQGLREGMAQGLAQGRKDGHQQALAEYRGQFQQAMTALNNAMAALDSNRGQLEATALVEVVELAIAIARRVTKRQVLIDPGVLAANLGESMKLAVKAADIRIAIHPAQRRTLDEALPQLQLQWPNLAHIQVVEDAAIAAGGCRIFTEHGSVNADLENQLDRVVAELLPVHEI